MMDHDGPWWTIKARSHLQPPPVPAAFHTCKSQKYRQNTLEAPGGGRGCYVVTLVVAARESTWIQIPPRHYLCRQEVVLIGVRLSFMMVSLVWYGWGSTPLYDGQLAYISARETWLGALSTTVCDCGCGCSSRLGCWFLHWFGGHLVALVSSAAWTWRIAVLIQFYCCLDPLAWGSYWFCKFCSGGCCWGLFGFCNVCTGAVLGLLNSGMVFSPLPVHEACRCILLPALPLEMTRWRCVVTLWSRASPYLRVGVERWFILALLVVPLCHRFAPHWHWAAEWLSAWPLALAVHGAASVWGRWHLTKYFFFKIP